MNTQQMYYQKVQKWLEDDELPTETELLELEASYKDWLNETLTNEPLAWDWELTSISTNAGEDWETESDEDLYTDLDPDWDEYFDTGRLY